jgi:hypothetical protein
MSTPADVLSDVEFQKDPNNYLTLLRCLLKTLEATPPEELTFTYRDFFQKHGMRAVIKMLVDCINPALLSMLQAGTIDLSVIRENHTVCRNVPKKPGVYLHGLVDDADPGHLGLYVGSANDLYGGIGTHTKDFRQFVRAKKEAEEIQEGAAEASGASKDLSKATQSSSYHIDFTTKKTWPDEFWFIVAEFDRKSVDREDLSYLLNLSNIYIALIFRTFGRDIATQYLPKTATLQPFPWIGLNTKNPLSQYREGLTRPVTHKTIRAYADLFIVDGPTLHRFLMAKRMSDPTGKTAPEVLLLRAKYAWRATMSDKGYGNSEPPQLRSDITIPNSMEDLLHMDVPSLRRWMLLSSRHQSQTIQNMAEKEILRRSLKIWDELQTNKSPTTPSRNGKSKDKSTDPAEITQLMGLAKLSLPTKAATPGSSRKPTSHFAAQFGIGEESGEENKSRGKRSRMDFEDTDTQSPKKARVDSNTNGPVTEDDMHSDSSFWRNVAMSQAFWLRANPEWWPFR